MNIDHFIHFIANIDDGPKSRCGFDMGRERAHRNASNHPCGTAMCIGGWAGHLLGVKDTVSPTAALSELLNIPTADAQAICWPDTDIDPDPYEATKEQAVELLQHYRATGVVDWRGVMTA